jgi:hypothetical protein
MITKAEARAFARACAAAQKAGERYTEDPDPEMARIYVWRKGRKKLHLHRRGPEDVRRQPALHDKFTCPFTGAWGSVSPRPGAVELAHHTGMATARWTCTLAEWRTLNLTLTPGESGGRPVLLRDYPSKLPKPTRLLDLDLFKADPKPVSAFRVRREG